MLLIVTIVIIAFSLLFWYEFSNWLPFISSPAEIWFCCFVVASFAPFICCKSISPDRFGLKLSSAWFLWFIKSWLLPWHCWPFSFVVGVFCTSAWMDVVTADSGDDNCVIELLLFPWCNGTAFNRLLQTWWDGEVEWLLIIPVSSLKMLPLVLLAALFDEGALRWGLGKINKPWDLVWLEWNWLIKNSDSKWFYYLNCVPVFER